MKYSSLYGGDHCQCVKTWKKPAVLPEEEKRLQQQKTLRGIIVKGLATALLKIPRRFLTMIKKSTNEIKSTAHSKLQMSVSSHSVCPQIQAERNIWTIKKGYRRKTRKLCGQKGVEIREAEACPGYIYVRKHTAAYTYITIYGISQGKKFTKDI